MIELKFTIEVESDWELLHYDQIGPAASEKALKAAAGVFERQEQKQIGRIAKRRIPTKAEVAAHRQRKTKKKRRRTLRQTSSDPAWKRSGDLGRGLKVTYPARNQAVLDVEGKAAAYAPSREGLGVDWKPKNPAIGVVRTNAYARDTEKMSTQQAEKVYEQTLKNELGLS